MAGDAREVPDRHLKAGFERHACGDAAALTVPKLGAIDHQECEVVGKQIAKEVGVLPAAIADEAATSLRRFAGRRVLIGAHNDLCGQDS